MGPMKDGRRTFWSCMLKASMNDEANDASSLFQSRSMDIVHRKQGLPFTALQFGSP